MSVSAHARLAGRRAEAALAEQMLAELQHLRQTTTEMAAHLRSQAVNGVLEVATLAFDAQGVITRSYQVACGSLVVINSSAASVTVQSGGPTGSGAPATGRGVVIVPASSFLSVPIAAHSFTLWGTATNVISFQAFTGMQPYGYAG